MRATSTLLVLGTALVLGGGGAFAQVTPQQPAQLPTTIEQAIRIAEQETGGRASKIEMEHEKGAEVYEIKTLSKEMAAKVYVELMTGKVLRVDRPGYMEAIGNFFDKEDLREDQAELARLEASSMTLAAAISAAEREHGGRAVEAKMKSRYGATLFEVAMIKDFAKQKIAVDPSTGKVLILPREVKKDDDD